MHAVDPPCGRTTTTYTYCTHEACVFLCVLDPRLSGCVAPVTHVHVRASGLQFIYVPIYIYTRTSIIGYTYMCIMWGAQHNT